MSSGSSSSRSDFIPRYNRPLRRRPIFGPVLSASGSSRPSIRPLVNTLLNREHSRRIPFNTQSGSSSPYPPIITSFRTSSPCVNCLSSGSSQSVSDL